MLTVLTSKPLDNYHIADIGKMQKQLRIALFKPYDYTLLSEIVSYIASVKEFF